jgi:F0F1-type ATP synthase membrane subunit c/vacuolar-type H+-ATPase subunit K
VNILIRSIIVIATLASAIAIVFKVRKSLKEKSKNPELAQGAYSSVYIVMQYISALLFVLIAIVFLFSRL